MRCSPVQPCVNAVTWPAGCIESAYIFPGIGLGTLVSRATRLRDNMLLAAAETLASLVTDGALRGPSR